MILTNFKLYESSQSLAIIIIMCLVGLMAATFSSQTVYAQNEQVGLNANVTTKTNLGNSGITSNSSAQANASAVSSGETNTQSKENSQSQATMQSQTNTQEYHHYKTSYAAMSSDSENSFTIETDKHLYKPGDDVKVEGSIWSGLIAQLGGANLVTFQILDNNGSVINNGTAQITSDGKYSTDFILPENVVNGTYSTNAKIEVSADLINSLTIKSQANLQSSAKFLVSGPNAFTVNAEGKDFDLKIASNSHIGNLQFDKQQKKITFTVSGETGTSGVSDITIPKSLLNGDFSIMIDGQVMSQDNIIETADTQDETTLEINYHHSTHTIEIVGTNAVPEFPTSVMILLVAISSIFALSLINKNLIKS
jgi:hypothetical protein